MDNGTRSRPRAARPGIRRDRVRDRQVRTLFVVDLRQISVEQPESLEVVPVRTMFKNATNQVHYHEMRVPADCVVGEVMMRYEAARLCEEGKPCGAEANVANTWRRKPAGPPPTWPWTPTAATV